MQGTTHPLLLQLNTRCWLRELGELLHHPVHFGNVPGHLILEWKELGFTHIWAMGVWTTGALSRRIALDDPALQEQFHSTHPGWTDQDVMGSPYAIAAYEVPSILGGESGLATFRKQLHRHGLKLILDFVPNHVAVDHPWVLHKPALFVASNQTFQGSFQAMTGKGVLWIAHGRDPYFPPWKDVAQLDYRNEEVRLEMKKILLSLASRCDGVRCDMAMLVVNEVFRKTWGPKVIDSEPPSYEFWPEAIPEVKKCHPKFLFLAECYWGFDTILQIQGFDFTYHKEVLDSLIAGDAPPLLHRLASLPKEHLSRCAHFLENHDEPRIASLLAPEKTKIAALVKLALPGMRMIYEKQMEGARLRMPVQFSRWPSEALDETLRAFYLNLLSTLKQTSIGRGDWHVLQPLGWPDNPSARNLLILQWSSNNGSFELVVLNFSAQSAQCRVYLKIEGLELHQWSIRDLLGKEHHLRDGPLLISEGLYLNVQGHATHLFQFKG